MSSPHPNPNPHPHPRPHPHPSHNLNTSNLHPRPGTGPSPSPSPSPNPNQDLKKVPTGTLYGPWMGGGEVKAEVFKHAKEDLFIFVHFSVDNYTKMVATKTTTPSIAHGKPRVYVGHALRDDANVSAAWDAGSSNHGGTDLQGKYLLKNVKL